MKKTNKSEGNFWSRVKPLHKKCLYSFFMSWLGWLPFFNIILILPFSFFLAYGAFKLALEQKKNMDWKKSALKDRVWAIVDIVLSVLLMLNSVIVWVIAIYMFYYCTSTKTC